MAAKFNLKPHSNAPRWVWTWAWRGHGLLLPLLHLRDRAPDRSKSLKVIWNKALASLDTDSPVFDNRWTYDLLPWSRWLLRIAPQRFPRLHHANIEIRTVYLNQQIDRVVAGLPEGTKVRLVSLGAGYDARVSRLLTQGVVQQGYELDLPEVVASKAKMYQRLVERRANETVVLPEVLETDLNDISGVRQTLRRILPEDEEGWHTIFLLEGVLIYLDEDIPRQLMTMCKRKASTLCFCDKLPQTGFRGDQDLARQELSSSGWVLMDWETKPGLACHMGVAV